MPAFEPKKGVPAFVPPKKFLIKKGWLDNSKLGPAGLGGKPQNIGRETKKHSGSRVSVLHPL